jgi:hypothetical protein
MIITERQKQVLQHALGADSRYKKRQWGFRNNYFAEEGHHSWDVLLELTKLGLMQRHEPNREFVTGSYFYATVEGAKAIGFNSAQIKRTFDLKTKE